MAIVSPHQAIYEYIFDKIGTNITLTEGADRYIAQVAAAGGSIDSTECVKTSFIELGAVQTIFQFYQQPPENESGPYIWVNLNTLTDAGSRDDFIYQLLAEFTVVTFADVNRSTKDATLLGQSALLKLFTPRGLNSNFTTATGDTVKIISQTLSSLEEGSETLAQKRLNFAKVNINFTVTF